MEKILVLDFGGQYNQLIARRVREHHVYAEIKPYNKITVGEIKEIGYKGIIFTGGPNSVYDEKSPYIFWTLGSPAQFLNTATESEHSKARRTSLSVSITCVPQGFTVPIIRRSPSGRSHRGSRTQGGSEHR